MFPSDAPGLLAAVVALGLVHGIEPGHGWPIAASYALDRSNKWRYGFAASLVIGVGHLVSALAVVGVFFLAKAYFDLTQINDPVTVASVQIGGPLGIVAGALLILLGIREYLGGGHGHDHDHDHAHDHGHAHAHDHDGDDTHAHDRRGADGAVDVTTHAHLDQVQDGGQDRQADGGLLSRLKAVVPVGGHDHGHHSMDDPTDRGLAGIASFALLLGFVHEEEFEIIGFCVGSEFCLGLMLAYSLAVVAGIVGLTLLLVGGYYRYEERVERITPYFPVFSAVVLVVMGAGFVVGVF